MAISFAQSGASQIAIGARSNLTAVKEAVLAAAEKANRQAPKMFCVSIDITSQASVQAAASAVEKEFGKLDILIINSGVIGSMKHIVESDPDDWWETWTVNLRGPYLVSRAFVPFLLKGGDKTIITLSSVGAHKVFKGLSDYQPSKLAVIRLMEFLSVEYGDQGLVSYCIHPGNIPTDMIGGPEGAAKRGLTERKSYSMVYLVRLSLICEHSFHGDPGVECRYPRLFDQGEEGLACWEICQCYVEYARADGKGRLHREGEQVESQVGFLDENLDDRPFTLPRFHYT